MKLHSVRNSFFSLVIGLAGASATVSTPQAADIGMPVLSNSMTTQTQMTASQAATPSRLHEESSKQYGAKGPIRTDFSDQTAKVDTETLRRDLQMDRYPMNKQVGIP